MVRELIVLVALKSKFYLINQIFVATLVRIETALYKYFFYMLSARLAIAGDAVSVYFSDPVASQSQPGSANGTVVGRR